MTRSILNQIFRKHFHQTPNRIIQLEKGYYTDVFRLDIGKKSVVFKLGKVYPGRSNMKLEARAMEELRAKGISTPEPLFIDSVNRGKNEYLIMSFVAGEPLLLAWPRFSLKKKFLIIEELLKVLSIISGIPVKGFGPLNQHLEGERKNLLEYINYEIEEFEKTNVRPMITGKDWKGVTKKLTEYGSKKVNPFFVHADFRLSNFIWDKEKLTILDFSRAMGLEPSFDFIRFQYIETSEKVISPKEAQWARNEYIKNFCQDDFEEKENIYRLLLTLRLSRHYFLKKKQIQLKQELQRMKQ